MDVLVCCEDPRDAEAMACAAERDLRRADWTAAARKAAASAVCPSADETERLGRNQQRRATVYGRARGRL